MSYNPIIPQAASKRIISQRQIQANFTAIFNSFAKNHSPLGNNDLQGKHNVLILRDQTNVGNPTTSATQVAFYQKLVGGVPNWFYRPSSNQTTIQMSYPSIKTGLQSINPDVYFPQQYSFMAGPFVIYGGKITNPNNGATVTLLPNTTLIYVGLTVTNFKNLTANFIGVAIPTNIVGNSFDISYGLAKPAGTSLDVYYVAIGI